MPLETRGLSAAASTLHVVAAALLRSDPTGRRQCLVARRGAPMSLPWGWEFPGGKVEAGEDPTKALARELTEELAVRAEIGPRLGVVAAPPARPPMKLELFLARVIEGEPRALEHAELTWAGPEEMLGLDWAPMDRPLVARVIEELLQTGAGAK